MLHDLRLLFTIVTKDDGHGLRALRRSSDGYEDYAPLKT